MLRITNVSTRRARRLGRHRGDRAEGGRRSPSTRSAFASGRVAAPRSWFAPTPSDLSPDAGAATGELVLRIGDSPEVHVPWAVAVPADVDLVSRLALKPTGTRISDATPAALSFVAGAVTAAPDPQVRAVELLEVELWRRGTRLGLLARRRELLPGRYTFGLTGRGATGARLPRGLYAIRLVAYPGDGTRKQSDTIEYRVR